MTSLPVKTSGMARELSLALWVNEKQECPQKQVKS
jgi:hypothetical protein